MRLVLSKERHGYLARVLNKHSEIAYIAIRLSGLELTIEFPSDWHENKRVWVRIGAIFVVFAFSFRWYGEVPKDEGQCSGSEYGFKFFDDLLFIHYGKNKGRRSDPQIVIQMPWSWKHKEHLILSDTETHEYRYKLRSGEIQTRKATIRKESRRWSRYWIPWSKTIVSINVDFDGEVGEGTGSWKGGTVGCGYNLLTNEKPVDCLRRMERERIFD